MSTLTRLDSNSKKPQYKDYVTFLESYKNGKKDDQNSVITNDSGVSFSLTNSSNNSSSSIHSDLTDSSRNGFKEYLENFNGRKYSQVQPDFIRNKEKQKNTVKTEVFIEITNPETSISKVSKVFEVKNENNTKIVSQKNNCNVSKVSKIFEENCKIDTQETIVNKNKVNSFNNGTTKLIKKNSIGDISKKFEEPPKNQSIEEPKLPTKKASSIYEVSKIFQENPKTTTPSLPKFDSRIQNSLPKPFRNGLASPKSTVVSLKPMITSPKPVLNEYKPEFPEKVASTIIPPPPAFLTQKQENPTSDEKTISSLNSSRLPPLPPPLPQADQPIKTTVYIPPRHRQDSSSSPPPPTQVQANVVVKTTNNPFPNGFITPPPPPLPPANFTPKTTPNLPLQNNPANLSAQNHVPNGTINVHNDGVDGTNGTVIDKNDPRVKKAVYGALRGMYGAYHDKANDYVATLPRNMVRKNNGLDSIINSIASQGGLDKLSGRANPNSEKE